MSHAMLERVAEATKPPTTPMYSPHGYIITPDGTTYTLLKQWFHGVVIACLFPEELAQFRLDPQEDEDRNPIPGTGTELVIPDTVDEINVFDFQKFEHAVHRKLDLVRICPTRALGPSSVDLPHKKPCTPEQMAALRLVMQGSLSFRLKTIVATDHSDMSLENCYRCAESGKDSYTLGIKSETDTGDWDD